MQLIESPKDLALLPARLALGSTMLYHGAIKLRGEGKEQHAQFFENVGITPAKPLSIATGVSEVFVGLSSLLGIGTRLAAIAVLVTQGVAIAKVHGQKGFSIQSGGFEFNLALMAIAAGLLLAGPGEVSTHELVERRAERAGRFSRLDPRRRNRRRSRRGLALLKLLK